MGKCYKRKAACAMGICISATVPSYLDILTIHKATGANAGSNQTGHMPSI